MGTGVSALEALVLICVRNDLFCYSQDWLAAGVCQWYVRCVSVTKLNTPSSNFRGRTAGPICQVFSWTDVPRMRLQLKILFGIKALTILKKSGKTCWGGGGGGGGRCHPHPHWRVKPMTCNRL